VDEQTITASLLRKLMSGISEDYCARAGSAVSNTHCGMQLRASEKMFAVSEEIEQLKYLSEKCGGWIIWNVQAKDERFVPMEEWLRLYEAKRT
jgi:hypothetical protein